jgi:hypothetical protein
VVSRRSLQWPREKRCSGDRGKAPPSPAGASGPPGSAASSTSSNVLQAQDEARSWGVRLKWCRCQQPTEAAQAGQPRSVHSCTAPPPPQMHATHLQPRSHHRLAVFWPTPGKEWKRARVAAPTLSCRRLPRESATAMSALQPRSIYTVGAAVVSVATAHHSSRSPLPGRLPCCPAPADP